MVTSKDFTEGMNNLFKEFNKLNPLKKLWYKITSKKSGISIELVVFISLAVISFLLIIISMAL